ncbi:MAG: di-heme oxidoredictase family protein [Flavobacteriales bacterium]
MRADLSVALLAILVLGSGCRKEPEPWDAATEQPWMSGGAQTVFDQGAGAFGHMFPHISADKAAVHGIGDSQFGATFVSAPAPLNPGLGPVFNSVSCTNCHISDGRGKPPSGNEQLVSMLFRLSMDGVDAHGGPMPVPGFGGQLQQRSIFGVVPEANVAISWTETPMTLGEGSTVLLRRPSFTITDAYTPMPAGVRMSARVAPPVFGLGLIEAIAESDIRAHADPSDADGDGISGRPNVVWDVPRQRMALGRFGWKAEQPSLLQQTASAYVEDMGITNPLFPEESCTGQPQYGTPNTGIELSDSILHAVAFYVRSLAVPARRAVQDPNVVRGGQLFTQAGCDRCHTPMQRTAVDVSFPEVSNQVIFPYTDLLLHDMGPDLADDRPIFVADGREWRTPPLWGIGLTQVVNGHQNFLHDGRARSVLEAVLWHGGEAERSRNAVRDMTASERQALLAFLNSL